MPRLLLLASSQLDRDERIQALRERMVGSGALAGVSTAACNGASLVEEARARLQHGMRIAEPVSQARADPVSDLRSVSGSGG